MGGEETRPQGTFGGRMETLDVCDDESEAKHSLGLKDGLREDRSMGESLEGTTPL